MKDLRILVTGVGSLSAYSILKSYKYVKERNIYIVGTDIKEFVPNRFVDKYYQNEKPTSKSFITNLLYICKKEKIDFLIPLVDDELEILSKNRTLFSKNNTIICLNDTEKIKLVQDKYRLYKYLEKYNIDVPRTYLFNNKETFIEGSKKLGYPNEVICYKPVISSGSRGFRIIDDNVDYESILFKEKPNSKYINYDFLVNYINNCKHIPEMMVMEYLPGNFYNISALAEDGLVLNMIITLETNIQLGNSFDGQVVFNDDIYNYCKKIIEILNLSGNVGLQVAYSKDNKIKLIEINIRINGAIFQSYIAGYNMPYYELKMRLGEEIPNLKIFKQHRVIRYLDDYIVDEKNNRISIEEI